MRLDYVPNPPNFTSEEDKAVLSRVEARRGERGLLPLDLTLLHAPKVADGWNAHLGAIRTKTSLATNIREIAILRPALINEAWFEWNHHLPIVRLLLFLPPYYHLPHLPFLSLHPFTLAPSSQPSLTTLSKQYQSSSTYNPSSLSVLSSLNPTTRGSLTSAEWAVLQYADAMTRNVKVPQELFNELRSQGGFNDGEIVEITATVATYNMVSRFLVALDVGEANGTGPEGVEAVKEG